MAADDVSGKGVLNKGIEEVSQLWETGEYRGAVGLMRSLRVTDRRAYLRWLMQFSQESEIKAEKSVPLEKIAYLADYETQVEEAKDNSEREKNRVLWFYEWTTVKPEVALDIFWSEVLPDYRDSDALAPYLAHYVGGVVPRVVRDDTTESIRIIEDAADLVYEQEDDDFDQGQLLYSLVRACLDVRRFDIAAALLKCNDLVPERHVFWFAIGWHSSNPDDVEAALTEMKKSLVRNSSCAIWSVLRRAERFLRKAKGSLLKRPNGPLRTSGHPKKETSGFEPGTLLRVTDAGGQSVFAAVRHAISELSDYRLREDCMGDLVDGELYKEAGKHLERLQRLMIWDEEGAEYVEEKLPELQLRLIEMRLDECSTMTATALQAHGFSKPISREVTNRSLHSELGERAWKRLSRHSGVVRFAETGEWAWQNVALLYSSTNSAETGDEIWDFAFLCAQFFKSVEEFLCQTLAELCPGSTMTLFKRGDPVRVGSDEYFARATAGSLMYFIKTNPTAVMHSRRQAEDLTSKLGRWTNEVRNAYQHRDVVHTESDARRIRGETLGLLKYMALFMRDIKGRH